jgi:FkbM family methyltransferase
MREPGINKTGKLYPKTKNYYQKVFFRRIFGKKLYKLFKVIKIVSLYEIGKEFEISYFIKEIIKKDFVIFDIGANLGQYALRLPGFANEGKVISVEPVYENYLYLQKLKSFYKIKNLECFNYAVSNFVGESILYIPVIDYDIELDTRATIDKVNYYFNYKDYNTQKVNITTIEQLFKESGLSRLDIIKSDTEGNDKNVLMGSFELIKKYLPMILIEDSHKEDWLKNIYEIGYLPFYVKDKIFLIEANKYKDSNKNINFDLLVLIHNTKLIDYKKFLITIY